MKIIFILALLTLTISVQGQTLKRTYYDYLERYKAEEYYVNQKGESQGKYKKFDRSGVISEVGSFKNGLLEGQYIKYATYSGRQELASKETYKEGELNGPATYYAGGGVVPVKSGNYVNGKKEGSWTFIDPYINYDLTESEKKGCEWYKSTFNYVNDEPQWEGVIETNYYPSGKPHSTGTYKNKKKVGEHKLYFPNGKLASQEVYSENGVDYHIKTWYYSGQLKMSEKFENGKVIYEGYDKDGNPDQVMQRQQAQAEANRIKSSGDSCLINHNDYQCARNYYSSLGFSDRQAMIRWVDDFENAEKAASKGQHTEAINLYENAWIYLKETSLAPYIKSQYDVVKGEMDRIEAEKKELASLDSTINSVVQEYRNIFVEVKNTVLVDQNNQPITRETYPKGQHLYKKSSELLQKMIEDYRATTDIKAKMEKGKALLTSLQKVNSLKDAETKDLNKQLKKTDDLEQIRKLLGL